MPVPKPIRTLEIDLSEPCIIIREDALELRPDMVSRCVPAEAGTEEDLTAVLQLQFEETRCFALLALQGTAPTGRFLSTGTILSSRPQHVTRWTLAKLLGDAYPIERDLFISLLFADADALGKLRYALLADLEASADIGTSCHASATLAWHEVGLRVLVSLERGKTRVPFEFLVRYEIALAVIEDLRGK